uniref:Sulfurtransferase n=1 Tax=Candidatus Kentrum sp. DK TaxID=2126562 RepID=A0A450RV11_9GAMM|nr:MAG: thiosulfate/3-mercaptopyruvate sulfurtransferase [Candidatus Kentron sp. DK]
MSTLRYPLLVEPEILSQHLDAEDLLIIDVSRANSHTAGHIPGAVYLEYGTLVQKRPPVGGLLPDTPQLSRLFSSIGLTPQTHVVAYDDEGGGKAGRLIWTLHLLGHNACSVLNGGLPAWANGKYPLTREPTPPPPASDYTATLRQPDALAEKEYILENLGNPEVALLDTRTPDEYTGRKRFANRGGHIPGAVNLNWTLSLNTTQNLRWKPEKELRAMFEGAGITPDKEVIVYCQTHHRASHTYAVLKHLEYPRVRGYAGSWSEWGNLTEVPVEEGR